MKNLLKLLGLLTLAGGLSACSVLEQVASKASSDLTTTVMTETTRTTQDSEQLYAQTLEDLKGTGLEGRATDYVFYDMDQNGTDELLVSSQNQGQVFLLAIYYLKNEVPTLLSQSYVASAGGYRSGTTLYTDGRVSFVEWTSLSGEGKASLYALKADNSGVDTLKSSDVKMGVDDVEAILGLTEVSELALEVLPWQSLGKSDTTTTETTASRTSSTSSQTSEASWNIERIQSDYVDRQPAQGTAVVVQPLGAAGEVRVFDRPDVDGQLIATYYVGDQIVYDEIFATSDGIWISYIGQESGLRRYALISGGHSIFVQLK